MLNLGALFVIWKTCIIPLFLSKMEKYGEEGFLKISQHDLATLHDIFTMMKNIEHWNGSQIGSGVRKSELE